MTTPHHPASRRLAALLMLALPLALGSCQALYFLSGKGTKDAAYKLPKEKRVLVFVDAPPSVLLPPGYAATLGKAIGDHLYKYKAADKIVAQDRLTTLRDDPTFSRLGIADVARATDADVIVYVNLVTFHEGLLSDGTVTQGDAQALVKVNDSTGKRLWPIDDAAGLPVDAHVEDQLAEQRSDAATLKEITNSLATRIGRQFHDYSLDDADMNK